MSEHRVFPLTPQIINYTTLTLPRALAVSAFLTISLVSFSQNVIQLESCIAFQTDFSHLPRWG